MNVVQVGIQKTLQKAREYLAALQKDLEQVWRIKAGGQAAQWYFDREREARYTEQRIKHLEALAAL